jgi:hypothetical protein
VTAKSQIQVLAQLEAAITDYIAAHNVTPTPFIWTAKAAGIPAKAAFDKLQN